MTDSNHTSDDEAPSNEEAAQHNHHDDTDKEPAETTSNPQSEPRIEQSLLKDEAADAEGAQ